jgi:FkbH-like protein
MTHSVKELEKISSTILRSDLSHITIASTSSLLPGHAVWRSLEAHHNLCFTESSEWANVLLRGPATTEKCSLALLVVFLQDVIPFESVSSSEKFNRYDDDKIRGWLEPPLTVIDGFLRNQPDRPLLLAWGNASRSNAIELGRKRPAWQQVEMQWERILRDRQAKFPSLFLLPMDNFFAEVGLNNCYDPRNFYSARCRLSQCGLAELARQVEIVVNRLSNPPKKVLLLDCDNTLWGGVIGEDGLAGIRLGQDGIGTAYVDFQKRVRELGRCGMLLALVSKNSPEDVWRVFDEHPSMILRREDISAARINWKSKSENIAELAQELNLGLDSFAFWDDNPFERESVRTEMPEVCTLDISNEVWNWPSWLESSSLFSKFEISEEDLCRKQLYEARSRFNQASQQSSSEVSFLKSIGLNPTIVPIGEALISRAVQLTNKTNQFNLRTIRYDEAAFRKAIGDKSTISFLVHLKDKFGDHGNVGLVVVSTKENSRIAFLDMFLLSCRVLSRHLEAWMLHECSKQLIARGIDILVAEFIPTERNKVAANFLREHGFVPIEKCDAQFQTTIVGIKPEAKGQRFAAHLSEVSIPHLEFFAA